MIHTCCRSRRIQLVTIRYHPQRLLKLLHRQRRLRRTIRARSVSVDDRRRLVAELPLQRLKRQDGAQQGVQRRRDERLDHRSHPRVRFLLADTFVVERLLEVVRRRSFSLEDELGQDVEREREEGRDDRGGERPPVAVRRLELGGRVHGGGERVVDGEGLDLEPEKRFETG